MRIQTRLPSGLIASARCLRQAQFSSRSACCSQAAFPKIEDTRDDRKALLRLPRLEDKFAVIVGSEDAQRALVSPLEVVLLDEMHAAVVTQATVVDENGAEQGHASEACLGARFLHQGGGEWALDARRDGSDYEGAWVAQLPRPARCRPERSGRTVSF